MDYQKKYNEYIINIEYLNGDIETVNYEESDTRSYKEMLKLYNQTKEHYKDDCVIIKFCGKSQDNQIQVLFQKQIITEDLEIKQQADRVANDTTVILNDFKQSISDLNKHRSYINNQVSIYDKKQSVILHKMEGLKEEDEDGRNTLSRELYALRIERRKAKNGQKLMENFYDKITDDHIVLKHLENIIGRLVEDYDKQIGKIVQLIDERVKEFRIMEEVKFRGFKERLRLVKELEKKYNKVRVNESKMLITCYNYAR